MWHEEMKIFVSLGQSVLGVTALRVSSTMWFVTGAWAAQKNTSADKLIPGPNINIPVYLNVCVFMRQSLNLSQLISVCSLTPFYSSSPGIWCFFTLYPSMRIIGFYEILYRKVIFIIKHRSFSSYVAFFYEPDIF